MIKYFFTLYCLLFFGSSFSQVTIKCEHLIYDKAALYSLEGEKSSFIDSISLTDQNEFQFYLDNRHYGLYRLEFNKNQSLYFLYDNEAIEIKTGANNNPDSVDVIKSESNKIYYHFIKLNKEYKTKSELLQLILARYPDIDDYYNQTKTKLIQIQKDYLNFVNVTSQKDPDSFIAKYVHYAQLPVVNPDIPSDKQLDYLKSHALDKVNFNDAEFIYSDLFTNKTIEYLSYYRNRQLPVGLLEKEFMTAIDTILGKAKVNQLVYQQIVEYLLDGFKKYGFDKVIDYIVNNYVIKDNLCLGEKFGSALERRIDQAKNFKAGETVPDIIIPDSTGKSIDLDKINSDKTLILFYASWCPHCQALIPKLKEINSELEQKNTHVLAISIDTSKIEWLKFVKRNNLNWLNVSDQQGWDGEAAMDYYVYATPTMFLVDKDKKLISIPRSIDELKKDL